MPDPLARVTRVLDALNCGAVLLDRAGTIVHVNRRVCEMMGRLRETLEGRSVLHLYEGTGAEAEVRDALRHFDEPSEKESFLPTASGERLPVVISSAPCGDEPPLSDYRVVSVIDVSRLKAAEEDAKSQYRYIAEISNTVIEQAMGLKDYSRVLEERVSERTKELHDAHLDAIYMLAVASEAKDQDTGLHVRRIQRYSEALARRLGLSAEDAQAMGYAAILHDVGKFHVRDAILKKPGPLTDAEREEMRMHTVNGERILSTNAFFDQARRIARSHHENWDGSGYPDSTDRSKVPLEARIVHVVDVYDALVNARVYKRSWPVEAALKELRDQSGIMFDPEAVRAFTTLVQDGTLRQVRIEPAMAFG